MTPAPTACQIFHLTSSRAARMTLRLSGSFFFQRMWFLSRVVGYVNSDYQIYGSSADDNGFALTRKDLLRPLLNTSHKLLTVVSVWTRCWLLSHITSEWGHLETKLVALKQSVCGEILESDNMYCNMLLYWIYEWSFNCEQVFLCSGYNRLPSCRSCATEIYSLKEKLFGFVLRHIDNVKPLNLRRTGLSYGTTLESGCEDVKHTLCEEDAVVVQSWTHRCQIRQERPCAAQLHPASPSSVSSPPSLPHTPAKCNECFFIYVNNCDTYDEIKIR